MAAVGLHCATREDLSAESHATASVLKSCMTGGLNWIGPDLKVFENGPERIGVGGTARLAVSSEAS